MKKSLNRKLPDGTFLSVQWKLIERFSMDPEQADVYEMLSHLSGRLVLENDENDEVVGEIEATLVDGYRILESGYSVYEVMDASNAELEEVASEFYGGDSELLSDLGDNAPYSNSSIYISRMMISGAYRGLNLSKILIDSLVMRFGAHVGAIILIAVPLQFILDDEVLANKPEDNIYRKLDLNSLDQDKTKAQKKLEKVWEKLGFKKYRKNFFYLTP